MAEIHAPTVKEGQSEHGLGSIVRLPSTSPAIALLCMVALYANSN